MKSASRHWWLQRVSAVVLIPLIGWIAIFVLSRMSADYEEARVWLGQPLNGGLMIVSLFVLYWHARLGLHKRLGSLLVEVDRLVAALRLDMKRR